MYVFQESGGVWTESQELLPTGLSAGDGFGGSVALDGRWLVAGAPNTTASSQGSAGCAYVYEWNGTAWTEFTKLEASILSTAITSGRRVTIDGNILAIAAPDDDATGAVHLFQFDGASGSRPAR